MRIAFVVAPLLLAACQQPASPPAEAPPPPSPPAGTNAITSADVLVGEYRIAGADGRDINLPHGISAIITANRIEVQADCIHFAWTYQFQGGVFAAERQPAASCRRALYPEEEAVAAAFDSANVVYRTPSNGVEFSGDGRSVTLFSQ